MVLHHANVVNCKNLVCLTPCILSVCGLCSDVVRTECYLCTMYCSSILSLTLYKLNFPAPKVAISGLEQATAVTGGLLPVYWPGVSKSWWGEY